MAHTIEQPRFAEQESSSAVREFILPSKSSRELFTGDPTSSISYDFNAAVIGSQDATGKGAFDLNEATFNAIMPTNWRTLHAGEALDAFDKAYETYVMRTQKVPEAQITTILSHEDSKSNPDKLSQINGINIPYEIIESDVDATEWAVAEQERRLRYVFHEAEYHLGRVFIADGQTYEVTHIEYTGTEGNYETLLLGFKNIETSQELLDIPLGTVEALVRSRSPEGAREILEETDDTLAEEYEQTSIVDVEETVQAELERYDEQFASSDPLERLEFENFLRTHPSLLTIPANLLPPEATDIDTGIPKFIEDTPDAALPVELQESVGDIQYDSDPSERIRNFHTAITHLALRHPLSDEMVADTIEAFEREFKEDTERDETLLQIR